MGKPKTSPKTKAKEKPKKETSKRRAFVQDRPERRWLCKYSATKDWPWPWSLRVSHGLCRAHTPKCIPITRPICPFEAYGYGSKFNHQGTAGFGRVPRFDPQPYVTCDICGLHVGICQQISDARAMVRILLQHAPGERGAKPESAKSHRERGRVADWMRVLSWGVY